MYACLAHRGPLAHEQLVPELEKAEELEGKKILLTAARKI